MHQLVYWVTAIAVLVAVTDILILPWILACSAVSENDADTLVLLHVLFRHGDRTPDLSEVYPNDPLAKNDFAPHGYGQLTKDGKRREYLIGKALRERYDRFLGLYGPTSSAARSTNYDRTKMSCLLVLSGLYPPSEKQLWDDNILWQPIPYDYEVNEQDQVLGDPIKHCPPFKKHYEKYLLSHEGQHFYKKNKEIYDFLSKYTTWDVKTPKKIYDLYFLLKSEETLGLQLPEWVKMVWPYNISILAVDEYHAQTSTPKMLGIAAGYLLNKILNDTHLKIYSHDLQDRKIYLYSAHEYNIAFLLKALNVFTPHIPPFGAYVTFEVHRIEGVYGIKILYQDYESLSKEPKFLKLDSCDTFCPLEKFKEIVAKYIPSPKLCEE